MKSYFANSVQAAMEQASRELGSEAVLVTSRPAAAGARGAGSYEVVFATELAAADAAAAAAPKPAPVSPAPGASAKAEPGAVLEEVRQLRNEVRSWRQAALRSSLHPSWVAGEPGLAELYAALADAEVDRDLAQQLLAAVLQRARGEKEQARGGMRVATAPALPSSEQLAGMLRAEMEQIFSVDSSLGDADALNARMVALVGPPGAGKTATLAKLAMRFGLTGRRPMQFISLDTLRVGASDQLRCYASLLGVGFQVVETGHALGQVLEEHSHKDLILIDTPGLGPRDFPGARELAEWLAGRADIHKHLVLPASMRTADMARTSAAYDVFRPSRLIFTRMDETSTFGPVLCEAASTGRPISFFGAGQRVPEDLEPAAKAALVDRLLPHTGAGATARTAA